MILTEQFFLNEAVPYFINTKYQHSLLTNDFVDKEALSSPGTTREEDIFTTLKLILLKTQILEFTLQ